MIDAKIIYMVGGLQVVYFLPSYQRSELVSFINGRIANGLEGENNVEVLEMMQGRKAVIIFSTLRKDLTFFQAPHPCHGKGT